jgi:sugar lactone lactonase YvrE
LTDSLSQQVFRFSDETHTFTPLMFPRPQLYPNGIALTQDGKRLYVADAFGVLQLDLRANVAREVNPGPLNSLAGIDGMYCYKDGLLAVQNGIGSPRVVFFQLSSDGLQVTSTDVLEYRSPLVIFPTTGAIDGSNFYFMTDTQVRKLYKGKIIDPSKLKPLRVAVVRLK